MQRTGARRDANTERQLLGGGRKTDARLIFEASISAKTIALRLVNSSERTKPLNRSHVIMKMSGVEGVKKPYQPKKAALNIAL